MTVPAPPGSPGAGSPGAGVPAPSLLRRGRDALRGPAGPPVRLGLGGSVLVTVGALGAGAVRVQDPLLESLHLSWLRFGHGYAMSSALVYVGVLMLLLAWVRLGRLVLAHVVGPRLLRATIVTWLLPLLLAPPVFSRDSYSYLAQGALLRDGFDPYAVGPVVNPGVLLDNVSTVWLTTPAPYGPAFIGIAETITRLTGDDVVAGTILMRLVMLPGLVLLCWALPRLTVQLGGDHATALWLAVLNPLVLVHLVGGAHNEMLMLGLLAAGMVLVLRGQHLGGVALIALGAAVKATALLALPFLVWVWVAHLRDQAGQQDADRTSPPPSTPVLFVRAAGQGAAVVVAVFAALSLLVGVGVGWLGALSGSNKIVNWLSLPTILGHVVTVGTRWAGDLSLDSVLPWTRALCGLLLAGVLVTLWWRTRGDRMHAARAVPLALLAVVVLSPAALPWYYAWPLALAAAQRWTRTALAGVAAGSAWLMLVFRPDGGIGMYTVFDVAVATVVAGLAFRAVRHVPAPAPEPTAVLPR